MSRIPRLLLAAIALNAVAGAAMAAEVIVEKAQPEHAGARFFERIQAGNLAEAISKRGQVVQVPAGDYHLRVPCDSMVPGSFTDIKVTIDEKSLTRLRLTECGVEVKLEDGHK
jgi:SOS-response transcriptional repressor LexA